MGSFLSHCLVFSLMLSLELFSMLHPCYTRTMHLLFYLLFIFFEFCPPKSQITCVKNAVRLYSYQCAEDILKSNICIFFEVGESVNKIKKERKKQRIYLLEKTKQPCHLKERKKKIIRQKTRRHTDLESWLSACLFTRISAKKKDNNNKAFQCRAVECCLHLPWCCGFLFFFFFTFVDVQWAIFFKAFSFHSLSSRKKSSFCHQIHFIQIQLSLFPFLLPHFVSFHFRLGSSSFSLTFINGSFIFLAFYLPLSSLSFIFH